MRYILVAAGLDSFQELYQPNNEDIIVAIDGGIKSIERAGLKLNIYVGDQDSNNEMDVACLEKHIFNTHKDYSDLELALKLVLEKCSIEDKIIIYNATGIRLDHFLSTINLLKELENENIAIVDKNNTIYIVNKYKEIMLNKNDYVSFYNIYEDTIIDLKGFLYNLDNYHMKKLDRLCLSNRVVEKGIVKVNKSVLVIESHD